MIDDNIFTSYSTKETINFAHNFATKLKKGTIVILDGELGSGKTVFAKGIGSFFKIKDVIKSPTYTIANSYLNGTFNHIDAYRLNSINDFDMLGIDFDNSISVIEWGEKYKDFFKNIFILTVKIKKDTNNKNIRHITIE